jgi:hypothetical protein
MRGVTERIKKLAQTVSAENSPPITSSSAASMGNGQGKNVLQSNAFYYALRAKIFD